MHPDGKEAIDKLEQKLHDLKSETEHVEARLRMLKNHYNNIEGVRGSGLSDQ